MKIINETRVRACNSFRLAPRRKWGPDNRFQYFNPRENFDFIVSYSRIEFSSFNIRAYRISYVSALRRNILFCSLVDYLRSYNRRIGFRQFDGREKCALLKALLLEKISVVATSDNKRFRNDDVLRCVAYREEKRRFETNKFAVVQANKANH